MHKKAYPVSSTQDRCLPQDQDNSEPNLGEGEAALGDRSGHGSCRLDTMGTVVRRRRVGQYPPCIGEPPRCRKWCPAAAECPL